MYKSPIVLNYADPIIEEVKKGTDEYCLRAILGCGVEVDKDELIKALKYDRDQYERGYHDGAMAGRMEALAENEKNNILLCEIKKIMFTLLLIPEDGKARPIKNTSKKECYNALFKIQELLHTREIDMFGLCRDEHEEC